jgi:hypothetical protein
MRTDTRTAVTSSALLGQQLGAALGAARALIDRTPRERADLVEELRRWYYSQHPDERDRLLWMRFTEAKSTHARLEQAIEVVQGALEAERHALVEAQGERETLASSPLPTTIEEDATGMRAEAVRRYQALSVECQQREAAIAYLERLLPTPESTLGPLTETTTRVLEAVVTLDREAFVRRLRESGELEHLRSRFERLKVAANARATEIEEWEQRVGHPVRVPRVAFQWPPAPLWHVLLDVPVEAPELVWDGDCGPPSAHA